jgi:hypothetical protein
VDRQALSLTSCSTSQAQAQTDSVGMRHARQWTGMFDVDPKAGGGWRHGPQPRTAGQGSTEDGQW